MSDANVKTLPVQQSIIPNTVFIKGRIEENPRRQDDGTYLTTIRTPSPDGFSAGSGFLISSKTKLGIKDDEISGHFHLSGWVKTRPYVDKKTGEDKMFIEGITRLSLID